MLNCTTAFYIIFIQPRILTIYTNETYIHSQAWPSSQTFNTNYIVEQDAQTR